MHDAPAGVFFLLQHPAPTTQYLSCGGGRGVTERRRQSFSRGMGAVTKHGTKDPVYYAVLVFLDSRVPGKYQTCGS
ncbi:hypothetical protein CGCTS75_v002102 [Colletotrichum tropicale]|nr:hypothetical protein CGCTS75_v002102 [Colletotrichum tropicale]